jgi:hypothetical protein
MKGTTPLVAEVLPAALRVFGANAMPGRAAKTT